MLLDLAGWLLAHPNATLGVATWAVALALLLLGGLVLARGLAVGAVAVLGGTLAYRLLTGSVAGGAQAGRKGKVWRGRHSPLYERHVAGQSPAWRAVRGRVLDRAGGRCEGCGRFVSALDVHHLTYARLGRERLADLEALCVRCHTRAHGGRALGFRGAKRGGRGSRSGSGSRPGGR